MKNLRLLTSFLAVLLVLGACGQPTAPTVEGAIEGSELEANAVSLIAASADETTEAGTARIEMRMTMTMPQGEVTMNADGAFNFAERLGEMSMQMEMPPEAGMGGTQNIEMVMDDLVIYMKYPLFSQFAPNSKPWIKMDLEKVGQEAGIDMGSLMQPGSSDPSQMLEWLRGASGDIEVVGEEEVRGAPATHYKGSIDLSKVIGELPKEMRAQMDAALKEMKTAMGSNTLPFEVWIDEQGRAVRMKQSFDFVKGATAGASMAMTMDIFDFGTAVDVEIPPPSQTTDFSDLMGSMSGAGTAP